ncbi:MAG TPA: tripartite tricarboxylate transporter substrate binding protein [Beijerinckiaceae bacterium]|jgi:putative tricarboxylic transport membrane protein
MTRVTLIACALTAGALALTTAATAQTGNTRAPKGPIEITVGTSPGGTPDVIMRRMAKILNDEKIVENPLVVTNRTGGSWAVSNNWVLGKKGDENTVYGVAQPVFTTPITQGQKPVYNQLTPIAMFIQGDLIVCAQPNAPATLAEIVKQAKDKPRSVKLAGAQAGSTDHMVTGLIEKAGDAKFNYIPFDGGGAVQAAFLGGNVDLMVLTIDEMLPLMQSKKLKPVAILSEQRRPEPELKDIPTAKEQGLAVVWGQAWGLAAPPETDPALVKWWDDKIARLVKTEGWKNFIKETYRRSDYVDSSRVKQHFEQLHQEHLAVLKDLGLAKTAAQ